jgi:hypothetical protein
MNYLEIITFALAPYQPYLMWTAIGWLASAIIGIPLLYIGFGFAMSAKRARDEKKSQRKVVYVDGFIAFWFVLLDAYLNVFVFTVLCLDFRPKQTFTLITGRLCQYNASPDERAFRRWFADVFAAFLDGKDPSGDHVKGNNFSFKWLD